MKHVHPFQLAALLAMTDSLRVPVVIGGPVEQHPPEPPVTPPLGKTLPAHQQHLVQMNRMGSGHRLRNLMGSPIRAITHEPPKNTQANERNRKRLRATIMKRAFWNVAMWDMTYEDRLKLSKAGISTFVVQEVLTKEPPPPGAGMADKLMAYQQLMDNLTPEQLAAIAAKVLDDAIPTELLEETVRDVTAELHRSGMVIIDDAGVVPEHVWRTEAEGSWIKPLLDLENKASYERNKDLWAVDPTAQHATLEELKGDARGLASRLGQQRGSDNDDADTVGSDDLPDRGPG